VQGFQDAVEWANATGVGGGVEPEEGVAEVVERRERNGDQPRRPARPAGTNSGAEARLQAIVSRPDIRGGAGTRRGAPSAHQVADVVRGGGVAVALEEAEQPHGDEQRLRKMQPREPIVCASRCRPVA
jgi:hypothetical protein